MTPEELQKQIQQLHNLPTKDQATIGQELSLSLLLELVRELHELNKNWESGLIAYNYQGET